MKKLILLSCIATSVMYADIANQTQEQQQKSESSRQQNTRSETKSDTSSITKNQGSEKSINNTLSRSLTETRNATSSVSKNKNGAWSISVNPIPHLLQKLREMGWYSQAFFLKNSDIGTAYYADEDEEIIDLTAKSYYESKASMRGKMNHNQVKKIEKAINTLYYTGTVVDRALKIMSTYYTPDDINLDGMAEAAIKQAYNETKHKWINIYNCTYGGDANTYTCNDGEYVIMLTSSVPQLIKTGTVYYSAEKIGFGTPNLTISFATNSSQAIDKLVQDSQSKQVAQAVRDYVSDLRSKGQSKVASEIESAFIEKALTTNVSNTASATIQAINSGSPISVLKIFQ